MALTVPIVAAPAWGMVAHTEWLAAGGALAPRRSVAATVCAHYGSIPSVLSVRLYTPTFHAVEYSSALVVALALERARALERGARAAHTAAPATSGALSGDGSHPPSPLKCSHSASRLSLRHHALRLISPPARPIPARHCAACSGKKLEHRFPPIKNQKKECLKRLKRSKRW